MSFQGPPPPRNYGPEAGLDYARDKIAAEERYADGMNLLREQRRRRGGSLLRRALRRLRTKRAERTD